MSKLMKIADIKRNMFVRTSLDEDRVLYFAELIGAGVELDPIKVTKTGELVDGRHRIEAYELNDKTEIPFEVVPVNGEIDLIKQAYLANAGGAKPPTRQDTEHTIGLLIERRVAIAQIAELLGLPPSVTRTYVSQVKSKAARSKLVKAHTAVTDGGLTVAKAAEQYEVDPEELKTFMSVRRRKSKNGIEDMQRQMTFNSKSAGSKTAGLFKRLLALYEDGDVSEKQVRDILAHFVSLNRRQARNLADWESRFNLKTGRTKKSA